MSDTLENSLKNRLEKIQCHFTWDLLGEDVDIVSVEERLYDQIAYLEDVNKHRLYNLLAYLKYLRGDHDEAILQVQKAEAEIQKSYPSEDKDFKTIVIYGNYAWLCYHQNQFTKSSNYADKVEAILKKYDSPSMKNTLLLDLYGEQGWTYLSFTGEYYKKASECFQKGLEIDPDNPDLYSGYAMVVYRMEDVTFPEKLPANSIPLLERAVKLNPEDTVMKALLALKYQVSRNSRQGEILIEEALQEKPESPYVLRYAGKFYRRARMTDKAIETFKKAIDLTPTSSALHYQLAVCYKSLIKVPRQYGQSTHTYSQETHEAISNATFHFEKALELNQLSVMAPLLLADVYIKAHEYQKAEEMFDKILNMKNVSVTQQQSLHLMWARYELYCKKRESESIKHFKEAIIIPNPTDYRDDAINDLQKLARFKLNQNPEDATANGLLDFIREQRQHEQGGYQQGRYQQGGYQQGGYQQGRNQQGGYQQGRNQQGGYQQGRYQQGGYQQGRYQQRGYQQGGYQQGRYQQGWRQQGWHQQGRDQQGWRQQGWHQQE